MKKTKAKGAANLPPVPQRPTPQLAPVIVTLVYDPNTDELSFTPIFETSGKMLVDVFQKATNQIVAFMAIERARAQARDAASAKPE